ncbi:hypothetical protein [Actinoplanes sp. GCM10030250]|uniref:hypothetical protein n=1 Tax=Actinoplanes sp. GCM10030250 TaxID=3273376 RepID=UPI00361B04DA
MSTHPQGGSAVPTDRPEYYQNVVSGNAHVGVQIGKNTGNVTVGQAAVPDGVAAELDRLLAEIRQAHRRGQIDTGTLADAQHEVEVTRAAMSEPAPDSGRAIRAMRRAGGMLDGIAGLGALAGSVVAAIESLTP